MQQVILLTQNDLETLKAGLEVICNMRNGDTIIMITQEGYDEVRRGRVSPITS